MNKRQGTHLLTVSDVEDTQYKGPLIVICDSLERPFDMTWILQWSHLAHKVFVEGRNNMGISAEA